MKWKAVASVVLPLAVAIVTLPCSGQDQTPATPSAPTAQDASTLGGSTGLDANSNDLASLYGTPVVQVIARVNDQVITNADLIRAQTQLAQEAHQENWSFDQYDHAQKNLLRDLVDQQLLLSKGKQLGITGDTELIQRLDEIRKQNHLGSMEDLEKAVEAQGTSYEDFKANIRNSIITQAVVRQEVGSKMQMSQADIRNYYDAHRDSFTQPESIHLNEILIPTSENPTDSELAAAEAKAKEVEAKLKAGGNFADLAKQYSGGPTAQQGGELGDFKRGALAKVLEDQTFDLPVGGYTQPIRTRQGYIILQVTAHNPGGVESLQKAEPEIEQTLYMQKIEPAVRQYLTRLREEAYIDIRPGYSDSGASPNETKPTFTAYVPPQPKKKKKKNKNRFERRAAHYGRLSDRRQIAAASTAAPASTAATAASSANTANANTAPLKPAAQKAQKPHKIKREKIRFGHAPETPVSAEQVASTSSSGSASTTSAAPADSSAATPATPGPDVQPLGPDLEHNPTLSKPKQTKTRFSDEARNRSAQKATQKHAPKVKKVKVDNAKPSSLTSAEAANQNVQSAPLGLAGDTTKKKKVKKAKVKNGEKTRLSDQKKTSNGTGASGPSQPASGGNPPVPQQQ